METQEYVNRIHSAVRTRLSSLNQRVSRLETELRFKAEVVQALESRLAELERGALPRPDCVGDLQHAGVEVHEEPGPPAQVLHLLAIEDGRQIRPTPEEHGAAAPSPEERVAAAASAFGGHGLAPPTTNTTASLGPGAGYKCSSERNSSAGPPSTGGQQTPVNNTIASLGLGAGYKCSSERNSSSGPPSTGGQQTPANNTIASLGLEAGYKCSSERNSSSEPLSIEDLSVLQQRLSSRFLAESPSTSTHTPQLPLNLSATPTSVIRKVQDEVKETEARISDLKSRGGPANQQ